MNEGVFTLADMAVGGGSAGLTFWGAHLLLKLLFDRAEKREARLDAGEAKLFEQMEAQIMALIAQSDANAKALQECKINHADSERRVMCLEMKVAQLSGVIG